MNTMAIQPTPFPNYLTTGEVSTITEVSTQTVINWIERSKLSCIRYEGGPRRIPTVEVVALLKRNNAPIPVYLHDFEAEADAFNAHREEVKRQRFSPTPKGG